MPDTALANTRLSVRQDKRGVLRGRRNVSRSIRGDRWDRFQLVNHYSDDHNNLLDDAMTMTCHELASRIEELQTDAMPRDVARLCLLLANFVNDIGDLEDESSLSRAWQEMGIRLQAATDQHAAMTEDLEELSRRDPSKFTIDQVWTLIRAIKVQSQILQLYVGQPTADV